MDINPNVKNFAKADVKLYYQDLTTTKAYSDKSNDSLVMSLLERIESHEDQLHEKNEQLHMLSTLTDFNKSESYRSACNKKEMVESMIISSIVY